MAASTGARQADIVRGVVGSLYTKRIPKDRTAIRVVLADSVATFRLLTSGKTGLATILNGATRVETIKTTIAVGNIVRIGSTDRIPLGIATERIDIGTNVTTAVTIIASCCCVFGATTSGCTVGTWTTPSYTAFRIHCAN